MRTHIPALTDYRPAWDAATKLAEWVAPARKNREAFKALAEFLRTMDLDPRLRLHRFLAALSAGTQMGRWLTPEDVIEAAEGGDWE